jgi:PAS domain S-box-containing protein
VNVDQQREARGPGLEELLSRAPLAYVAVDRDGRVVEWNDCGEELFGWRRQDVLGKPVDVLVVPRSRTDLADAVREVLAPGDHPPIPPFVVEAVRRDGEPFPAECTVWGSDEERQVLHAFVRDVTERQKAEEASARLAAVVEGSCDPILTTDLSGIIRSWNPAAERAYGWTAEEAVGRHVELIVPPEELSSIAGILDRITREESVLGYQGERCTRGGTRVPVSIRISPVRDRNGEVVAASSIARDETESRWLAETLDTTLNALQEAADEARAAEARAKRFLSDAAHQLRTPVTGLRACAETLLRTPAGEDAEQLLAVMVRETARAGRLVNELLQVARLDEGLVPRLAPVDVVAICRDEAERLALLSRDLDVRMDVERAPTGPCLLDDALLSEVLGNLADNARRHARKEIVLRVSGGDDGVHVVVWDDGPGLPAGAAEEVFERFVSLDGAGGSGLGLAIARGMARALGGDLWWEDGFVLALPYDPSRPVPERRPS